VEAGILLNDEDKPERLRAIAREHRRYGTTSCLPTDQRIPRRRRTASHACRQIIAGPTGSPGSHLKVRPCISALFCSGDRGLIAMTIFRSRQGPIWIWLGERSSSRNRPLVTLDTRMRAMRILKTSCERIGCRLVTARRLTGTLTAIDRRVSGVYNTYHAMPAMSARELYCGRGPHRRASHSGHYSPDGMHVDAARSYGTLFSKKSQHIALSAMCNANSWQSKTILSHGATDPAAVRETNGPPKKGKNASR